MPKKKNNDKFRGDLAEKHFKNAQLGFWKSRKIVNDALIKMMMDCLQAVRLVYVK